MTDFRPVTPDDLPALKAIISATDLFPADMLDDMIAGFLSGQEPYSRWMTDTATPPRLVAYCAPEPMTEGTHNLYLIAVHPDAQGAGLGARFLAYLEEALADAGTRILLVETSGTAEFTRTREFYDKNGYEREARIRDFYQSGDDKIIFRKALKDSV